MHIIYMSNITNWLFILYVASIPFDAVNLIGAAGTLTLNWVLGVLYILFEIFRRNLKIGLTGMHLWVPLFIMIPCFTLSSILNININSDRLYEFSFLANAIISYLFFRNLLDKPEMLTTIQKYYILSVMISSCLYFLDIGIEYEQGRVRVMGEDSNYTAMKYVVAACFILRFIKTKIYGLFTVLVGFAFIAFLFVVVINLGSRVGFISFAVILIIYLISNTRINSTSFYVTVLSIFVILISFNNYIANNDLLIFERLSSSLFDGDLSNRDVIWKEVLGHIDGVVLFGYGYSGYDAIVHELYGEYKSTHNVFLEIYVLGGLLSLTIFAVHLFIMLIKSLRLAFSGSEESILLLVVLFACLLSLQFFTFRLSWYILLIITFEIYFFYAKLAAKKIFAT